MRDDSGTTRGARFNPSLISRIFIIENRSFFKKIFEENPKMCYNIVVDEKIVFSSQMTAILTLIFSTKYMRDDF